jgi:hypothetical protein
MDPLLGLYADSVKDDSVADILTMALTKDKHPIVRKAIGVR